MVKCLFDLCDFYMHRNNVADGATYVLCSDSDINCEQLQVVPSNIYILLYFFLSR